MVWPYIGLRITGIVNIAIFKTIIRSMATRTDYSMTFVTVPSEEAAKTISHGLVEKKLAACVNIIPRVKSVYEWEGKINEDSELLLMIKTRTSAIEDLTTFVRENHPYSVCEVISTSIEQGNKPYLDWIGSFVPDKR
ncbi:hypothetical protein CHUAL_009598 [Chamberlinius hualienensis]